MAAQAMSRKINLALLAALTAIQFSSVLGLNPAPVFVLQTAPLSALLIGLMIYSWHRDRKAQAKDAVEKLRFAQAAEALFKHSMVTLSDPNCMIQFVNDKFLETTGFTRDEVIGSSAQHYMADCDPEMLDAVYKTVNLGETVQMEARLRCKEGPPIWTNLTMMPTYDTEGNFSGCYFVRTDISEVKKALAQQGIFDALDHMVDEIYLVDVETMTFRYVNSSGCRTHGWTATEYRNLHPEDVVPEMQSEMIRGVLARMKERDEKSALQEFRVGERDLEIRIQMIKTFDGREEFLAVARDKTREHAADRARRSFVSDVSHELRTPMTSIKGSLGLALSGATGELPEKARMLLEIAHRNSDHLINIINDLLDIEKIAAGQMPFDLKSGSLQTLVADAVSINQPFAEKHRVRFKTVLPEEPVTAWFDTGRTMQVLCNLISNAAKFSPAGGSVEVGLRQADGRAEVWVRDQGIGIPQEALSRIFERFTQMPNGPAASDRSSRGTGLGLAISKAIIEQQQGRLSVESKTGEGSVFRFTLPLETVKQDMIAA